MLQNILYKLFLDIEFNKNIHFRTYVRLEILPNREKVYIYANFVTLPKSLPARVPNEGRLS